MKQVFSASLQGLFIYCIIAWMVSLVFPDFGFSGPFLFLVIGQMLFRLIRQVVAVIYAFLFSGTAEAEAYRSLVSCKFPVTQWPDGESLVWKQEWDDYCRIVIEYKHSSRSSLVAASTMLAAFEAAKSMGIGVAFGLNRTYQRALDKYLQDNQSNFDQRLADFMFLGDAELSHSDKEE